ncbi:MBL fold metallo-hydrolase [Nocardia iowensis]|nr:MBL fold metallo-hydrolase [Nocardia iowensis]
MLSCSALNRCRTKRLRRPPRLRSVRLGDMRVTYVPDGAVRLRPRGWLPETTDADWATHADHLDQHGNLVAGIGALLVEHREHRLLIDAGVGPISVPDGPANPLTAALHGGALLDNLTRLRCTPAQLDAVAITHMHIDHLGWAFRPEFARTRLLIADAEWAWWNTLTPQQFEAMLERMAPWAKGQLHLPELLAALVPRVETFAADQQIAPSIISVAMAGHTAGHTAFGLTSGQHRMLIFSDAMHSPLQVQHPQWRCAADLAPAQAVLHRQRLIDELAASGDLAAGIHFADVPFGRVRRRRDGTTTWQPLR